MAWNMMRGLEWSAIPILAEKFGIEDVDEFIDQLVVIRDHHANR